LTAVSCPYVLAQSPLCANGFIFS